MKKKGILGVIFAVAFTNSVMAQFEGNSLSQAVDNTAYNFQTGNPGFIRQTGIARFGGDAAASQNISDGQTAIMFTQFIDTIGRGGTISFDWKVSSEQGFDGLEFLILDASENVVAERQISGEKDWAQITLDIPVGNHTLAWGYVKDDSISSGLDAGYVDRVRITRTGEGIPVECRTNPSPLKSVLDNEELEFTDFFGSSERAEFECQTEVFTAGGSAAKSKPVLHSGSTSQMFTTVEGPIDLVFDWRIAAGVEDIFQLDLFEKQINFDASIQITGTTDWETFRLRVPRGSHHVRWIYRRFSDNPVGDDAGYVDNVRIEPPSVDPRIKAALPAIFSQLLLKD